MSKTNQSPTVKFALAAAAALWGAAAIGGCAAHDRSSLIPPGATTRSEGTTHTISYTPDTNGTAYVWDDTEKKLLWTGRVNRGEMVAVDTQRNEIRLDTKVVHDRNVPDGHRYQIAFDPREK